MIQVIEPGPSEAIEVIGLRPWAISCHCDGEFALVLQMRLRGKWHDVYDHGKPLTLSSDGPTYAIVAVGVAYRAMVKHCDAPVTIEAGEMSAFTVTN